MAVKWTKNLSVGVDFIDKQHQIWFQKANDLFEAGQHGKASAVISDLLKFLDEYTKSHFRDEEKYMLQINYPEYGTQKKLHESFITELANLRKEYDKSGGNVVVIISANQMVINWLTKHITIQDKKIGEFVKSKAKR